MTKDTIVGGGLAGIIGNIPKEIITWLFYFNGLVRYTFDHFCAGIYVRPHLLHTWPAMIVGLVADFTFSGLFGVLILLALRRFGTKFLIIKGIGFGCAMFVFCFGMLRPVASPRLILGSPFANFLYIIPHLLFALTTCWFIKRWVMAGVESPDKTQ